MSAVYIPSKGRSANLDKLLPAWIATGVPIFIVVEGPEKHAYQQKIKKHVRLGKDYVELLILPRKIKGMGAIRQWCLEHALGCGYDSIIMADDDLHPHHSADVEAMLEYALESHVLGIGCVVSQHDLLLGERAYLLKEADPIYCSSGYGFRMFGLNVHNALDIGGFDPALDVSYEDAELMRAGIAAGLGWFLSPLTRAVSIGARFEPGGIAALTESREERDRRTLACHKLVYDRWPDFITAPGKQHRCAWKKMLDFYQPEWRDEWP